MEHTDNLESVNNDDYLSLTTLLEGAKNGSSSCMVRLAYKNQKHRIYFDGMSILPQFGITECLIQYKCSVNTPPPHAIRSG